MASYEIEISRTAEKQLKKLAEEDQLRVARAVLALVDEPRPGAHASSPATTTSGGFGSAAFGCSTASPTPGSSSSS